LSGNPAISGGRVKLKTRPSPDQGTNARSAVPPHLGWPIADQKIPPVQRRDEKASLTSFWVRPYNGLYLCLDNGGNSGAGYSLGLFLPATPRSIQCWCAGGILTDLPLSGRRSGTYSSSSMHLYIRLWWIICKRRELSSRYWILSGRINMLSQRFIPVA